jgi:twitching motility protein PilT
MPRIDSFLRLVVEQHASDLHFAAGSIPTVRHDGELIPLPFRELSELEAKRFLLEIVSAEDRASLEQKNEVDFVYALTGVARFRVNMFHEAHGLAAVFRVVPEKVPVIDELMLPRILKRLVRIQNGLVLICGPTGSGKTSTLAACVEELNSSAESKRHIITIEDPIEYLHRSKSCLITQRQVGVHTGTFAKALRSALRESPDVLIIGEMRDLETVSLALAAAETGILVFATLHTNSAAKALDRMIDNFPDDVREQMRAAISVLLRGVVSQHLIRRADGEGRIAVAEVLLQSYAVSNMIRENKVHQIQSYLQSVDPATGMQSLDAALYEAIKRELVAVEDGMALAEDPAALRGRVQALQGAPAL